LADGDAIKEEAVRRLHLYQTGQPFREELLGR
jgi:hypothetical protein